MEKSEIKKLHFLHSILGGIKEMSEDEIIIRRKMLQLDKLLLPSTVVCIAPNFSILDYHVIDESINDCEVFINRFLGRYFSDFYTVLNAHDNIQVILHSELSENFDEIFISLQNEIETKLGLELFIGIGSTVYEFSRIQMSSSEAYDMLAYKYQYANKGVINIKNIIQFRYNLSYSNNEQINRVVGCFQDGNLSKMSVRMDELIHEIRFRPKVSNTSIKRTMIEVVVHILHIAANAGVDVDYILGNEDPYRWIMMQDDTPVIKDWIMSLSAKLVEQISQNQKVSENSIIKSSCDYIEAHISDPNLGLQSVSEFSGLSSPYFSQLFKNELGIGVNSYITKVRVDRAKYILSNSELKAEDIALQLGFTRANYFSKIFKKEVGVTPGEYRRKSFEKP